MLEYGKLFWGLVLGIVDYIFFIHYLKHVNEENFEIKYSFPFHYNVTHTIFNHSQIPFPINKSTGKPLISMVIAKCLEEKDFFPNGVDADIYYVHCNNETKLYDAREASLFLSFIINTYDNPVADYYFFAHNHEKSWHYLSNLSSQIKRIYKFLRKVAKTCGPNKFMYHEYTKISSLKHIDVDGWKFYQIIYKNISKFPRILPPALLEEDEIVVGFPCCTTMIVPIQEIRKRPKEEYIEIKHRIRNLCYNAPHECFWVSILFEFTMGLLVSGNLIIPECPR